MSVANIQYEVEIPLIGQIISQYRILNKVGEGGMGAVYRAQHTTLGRPAAIKFLKDATLSWQDRQHMRARFKREANVLSSFSHPHIASVYEYGETAEGEPYIIMEWVDGQMLNDLLRRGKLSVGPSLKIIEQVAEALAEAHRHRIIHRDIKPSNIAINQRGQVKVLDFGLAKQVNRTLSDNGSITQSELITETRKGFVPGTPQYMSPEQALDQPLNASSDIFSLGAILYECTTGKRAFTGATDIEICTKLVYEQPPSPSKINPEVSPKLERITLKCLAKNASDRYQTVEELLAELHIVSARLGIKDQRLVRRSWRYLYRLVSLTRIYRRSRALRIIAILIGILILGCGLWNVLPSYRRSVYQPPVDALRWYEKGTAALRDGTYYKASRLFKAAIDKDPNFILAHAGLAEAWTELDYTDKAKVELNRVKELTSQGLELGPVDTLRLKAMTSTINRDFPKALESYNSILPLVSDEEKPAVYMDLGRAYDTNEELLKAIEQYSEATRRDNQNAAAFLRLGIVLGRKKDLDKADGAFAQALRLFQIPNEAEGVTEVLYQRAFLANELDKGDQAQQYLEQALDMGKGVISKPQRIKIMLLLSSVVYSAGKSQVAQQIAREAMEMAKQEELENFTTTGLIEIGNAYTWQGKYIEAEQYFNQALEIAQDNKGWRGVARAQLALASLYVQQVNPAKAMNYLDLALQFYQQGNYRKQILQALLVLARANELLGNNEAAMTTYEQEIQLAKEIGDLSQAAYAHIYLGSLLSYQEKFPQALVHFEESYRIDKDLKAQPRLGYDWLNRGNVLWQLGRYRLAREALDEASSQATQSAPPNDQLLAWIKLFRAQAALSDRRFNIAISESRDSLSLAGTQYKDIAAQATGTLGLAEALSGMRNAGERSCQLAINLAKGVASPRLIHSAQLASAEAQLKSGHTKKALETALVLQETFARSSQRHSYWRACLVAALASKQLGNKPAARRYAAQANDMLTELRQEWGEETFNSYLSRPDVEYYHKEISEILAQ